MNQSITGIKTMDTGSKLLISMFFGSIGVGFFIYGRKQQKGIPLLVGVILCVYPYFVDSLILNVLIGGVLCALPWFLRD